MHVVRPEDEDRVRKEGYDRCFRKRIRKIYAKHLPHISSDEVEQDIHEAGADVREFYKALCEQYGEIAGIPLWEPPDDRPDWFPDFLNSKEEGLDEDKPESEDEAVAPKDVPSKKKVESANQACKETSCKGPSSSGSIPNPQQSAQAFSATHGASTEAYSFGAAHASIAQRAGGFTTAPKTCSTPTSMVATPPTTTSSNKERQ